MRRGRNAGYVSREGNPIERMSASERAVKQETLPNGLWVSTVWLGLNHSQALNGPPLIYETMVFPPDDYEGEHPCQNECERYPTEEAAIAGHEQVAAKWRDWQENSDQDEWHERDI